MQEGRRFYLYQRGKRGMFYARLIDRETGLALTAKSTGKTNRDDALSVVFDWLKEGVPHGKQKKAIIELADLQAITKACRTAELSAVDALGICAILRERGLIDFNTVNGNSRGKKLLAFLEEFWDADKSPYIQDKITHGQRVSARYIREQVYAQTSWKEFFNPDKALSELTRQDLRDFGKYLFDKGLSSATINNKLNCGILALSWAAKEGIIPANPAEGLTRYSGGAKKREVLTESEMTRLFQAKWNDKRAYVAALVSSTTGMRLGEVRALRKDDIKDTCIEVRHSFSDLEGLKTPKNGEARLAPLYGEVRAAVLDLLKENPHTDMENPFIFYSEREDKPLDGKVFLKRMRQAMRMAGIDTAGRKIDFHSLRHYEAFKLAIEKDIGTAQIVLGHKTRAMTEHYAAHQSRELMENLVREREANSRVLKFKEAV